MTESEFNAFVWESAQARPKDFYEVRRRSFRPTVVVYNGHALGPVADAFFSPPEPEREASLVATLLNENRSQNWRSPLRYASVAEFGAEPSVSCDGGLRPAHTRLTATSFAVHPFWGPGHVLRTDGRVAAFWNGEVVRVVHFTNCEFVSVVVGRESGASRKETRGEARARLLASI